MNKNSSLLTYRVDILTRKCELVWLSFEVNEITCRNIDENLSKAGGCHKLT